MATCCTIHNRLGSPPHFWRQWQKSCCCCGARACAQLRPDISYAAGLPRQRSFDRNSSDWYIAHSTHLAACRGTTAKQPFWKFRPAFVWKAGAADKGQHSGQGLMHSKTGTLWCDDNETVTAGTSDDAPAVTELLLADQQPRLLFRVRPLICMHFVQQWVCLFQHGPAQHCSCRCQKSHTVSRTAAGTLPCTRDPPLYPQWLATPRSSHTTALKFFSNDHKSACGDLGIITYQVIKAKVTSSDIPHCIKSPSHLNTTYSNMRCDLQPPCGTKPLHNRKTQLGLFSKLQATSAQLQAGLILSTYKLLLLLTSYAAACLRVLWWLTAKVV